MKISVCIATYNGEEFVARQLDSVLKQLKQEDEIIIVDDYSIDRTLDVIKGNYGERVKIIRNNENLGVIKSFERAISIASGDIIFLCDQDDVWESDKVATVLAEFSRQNAELVVHDAFVVDGELNLLHSSWNDYNQNHQKGLFGNVVKNSFTGCCMAFRNELKKDFLPFPDSIDMHDQWIALVAMMKKRKIVYIDQPLIKYVRHGGNVTGTKKRTFLQKVKGRINISLALLKAKIK